jgi:hypothetical protein
MKYAFLIEILFDLLLNRVFLRYAISYGDAGGNRLAKRITYSRLSIGVRSCGERKRDLQKTRHKQEEEEHTRRREGMFEYHEVLSRGWYVLPLGVCSGRLAACRRFCGSAPGRCAHVRQRKKRCVDPISCQCSCTAVEGVHCWRALLHRRYKQMCSRMVCGWLVGCGCGKQACPGAPPHRETLVLLNPPDLALCCSLDHSLFSLEPSSDQYMMYFLAYETVVVLQLTSTTLRSLLRNHGYRSFHPWRRFIFQV